MIAPGLSMLEDAMPDLPPIDLKRDSEHVLIALSGLSPAVVTETVYALASQPAPFVPTRVVIVTTAEGKRRIERQLLADPGDRKGSDQFAKLCQAHPKLGLGRLALSADDIRVPRDASHNEFDDDSHEAESLDRMGDLILQTICEFVGKRDSVVCVSISGGRKSMSYLAGVAMTLVGRPQDRLVHVLLAEPRLERAVPTFYFPPIRPTKYTVTRLDGSGEDELFSNKIDTRIVLAEVPLLRLGALLPDALRAENIDPINRPAFSDYVRNVQRSLTLPEEIEMRFDAKLHRVICHGQPVVLSQEEFVLLHCLAERRESGISSSLSDEECRAYLDTWRKYERLSESRKRDGIEEEVARSLFFHDDSNDTLLGLNDYEALQAVDKNPESPESLTKRRKDKFQGFFTNIRTKLDGLGSLLSERCKPEDARKTKVYRLPPRLNIVLMDESEQMEVSAMRDDNPLFHLATAPLAGARK